MTKNPYINAGAAALYIVAVVLFINSISGPPDTPDTWFTPIMVLSLFVFSAAFMGYTFFFHPVQMYLDGQKQEAVSLFTRTLLSFGVITAGILILGLFLA